MSFRWVLAALAAVLTLSAVALSPASAAEKLPRHYVGVLDVTGVSAPNIAVTNDEDQPVTVQTSDQTIFWKAGTKVGLGDVAAGDRIRVRGQLTAPGVVEAAAVQIMPTRYAGQVTVVNGSSFTLQGRQAGQQMTWNVVVNDATKYLPAKDKLALQNIVAGARVRVAGFLDGNGNLVATQLWFAQAVVGGVVKNVQGNAITIDARVKGQTESVTVAVSDNTKYFKGKNSAALSDVTVESRIRATGFKEQNGQIDATVIRILPAPAQKSS